MRLVTSLHRLVLLVLVCLVSTTSADDVTHYQSDLSSVTSRDTWNPGKWLLSDPESTCDPEVDNNELLKSKLKNQKMEKMAKSSRLEEEVACLKQQAAAQEALNSAALEVEKLKLKHEQETFSLMVQKQAAIDETHRYKRQFEELNIALERVKRELRGEIITQTESVKNELRKEIRAESERVKVELQQECSKMFDNITQEIKECRKEVSVKPTKEGTKLMDKVKDLKMVQLGGSGNFYYFSIDKMRWTEAQTFCRSHGLELAAIESAQENTLIMNHKMKTYGKYDVWLGGTNEGHEGHWVWSGSQQNVTFTNWYPGEPGSVSGENCMCIGYGFYGPRQWWDRECYEVYNFVCEASVPLIT